MATASKFLILSLLWFAHDANGSKNGIVGFGISLYPDLCCQACHDSLSSLYLTCTTFTDGGDMAGMDMRKRDMGDMMMMGTTSDECRANNTAWLQTMAYCIQQNCDADGYPADKQAECFSNQAVAGAPKPTFQESLPAVPPTVELPADAVWLNTTSLVNKDLYYSTHGTLAEFGRSEYLHTRYSYVSVSPCFFSPFSGLGSQPIAVSLGWRSISSSSASALSAVCWLRLRARSRDFKRRCKLRLSGQACVGSSFSRPCSAADVSNRFPGPSVTYRAAR
jgi:hypothetical protein